LIITRNRKQIELSAITFLIAAGTLLLIYCKMGIFPFGDRTMLVWDMDYQYSSFMAWMSELLKGKADFPYSLHGGLGGNMYGLVAYYLGSPLNLLLIFFDQKTVPLVVTALLVLKTGLTACIMQYYLYKRREDTFSVIFGCFYALSSFAVCYQYNIMWMDALFLLPIVIYGLDKLLRDQSYLVYTLSLALAIISNYYFGFMICIFCVIYYTVTFVYLHGFSGVKEKRSSVICFIKGSLLSGGLSTFVILPGMLVLIYSSIERVVTVRDLLNFSLTSDVTHISRYLWAGGFDDKQGILGTYPLIYCGSIMVFLVTLFFISFKISLRKKIYYAIMLGIMMASLVFVGPYLLWHGASDPSGCYWRYAFIWVFLNICFSYDALVLICKEHFKAIFIAYIMIMGDILYITLRNGFRISYIANLGFVLLFVVLYFINSRCTHYVTRVSFVLACFAICIFELFYNGIKIHTQQFETLSMSYDEYEKHADNAVELFNQYDIRDKCSRNIILNGLGREYNLGFMYGVNSITTYSSTENKESWKIYEELGLGNPYYEIDAEYDTNATLLTTGLLGIHYIVCDEDFDITWIPKAGNIGSCSVYENEDYLPLGFLVNENALSIEWEGSSSLFINQNLIYHSLAGATDEDPYICVGSDTIGKERYEAYQLHKLPQIFRISDNQYTDLEYIAEEKRDIIKDTIGKNRLYTKSINVSGYKLSGEFEAPDENCYVCFSVPYEKSFLVYVDGKRSKAIEGMGGMMLVKIPQGQHNVEIKYMVPGMIEGIIITIICIILMAIDCYVIRKKYSI